MEYGFRRTEERNEIEETIDEKKAFAMALFGLSALEASRLTIYEYELYLLSYQIKREKDTEMLAVQSWFNQTVQATKTIGAGKNKKSKSIYKTFNDFYDSKKEIDKIIYGDINSKQRKLTLAELNRRINKKRGG